MVTTFTRHYSTRLFFFFFERRHTKDKAFSCPVPDIETLKARVTEASATATKEMLENIWQEIERTDNCSRLT